MIEKDEDKRGERGIGKGNLDDDDDDTNTYHNLLIFS